MNDSRLVDYLDHIAQAARQACDYVDGMDRAAFLADRRTQQATILNLIVIGEAATRLLQASPDFLAHHPEVPWASMKGMPNRIAHGYFDIDLSVGWETLQTSPPALLAQLPAVQAHAASRLPADH